MYAQCQLTNFYFMKNKKATTATTHCPVCQTSYVIDLVHNKKAHFDCFDCKSRLHYHPETVSITAAGVV